MRLVLRRIVSTVVVAGRAAPTPREALSVPSATNSHDYPCTSREDAPSDVSVSYSLRRTLIASTKAASSS